MFSTNKPISRNENIVIQETDNEVLIYDLKKHKALCLNETSALVWSLCDGKTSVSQISQKMSEKLNHPVSEEIILLALGQLCREELINNAEELEVNLDSLTRRKLIRKIGINSLIVLPLVSSIVAPSALSAASIPPAPLTCANTPGVSCLPPRIQGCICTPGGSSCATGFMCVDTNGNPAAFLTPGVCCPNTP